MGKTEIEDKININILNFKIFIISILIFVPLLGVVMHIANKLPYNSAYFIIFSLIAIVGFLFKLEQNSTTYVIFNFKDNELLIEGKQNKSLSYSKILNFNLYSLFPKNRLGYILRLKQEKGNFYFWITTKNRNMKWSEDGHKDILILNNFLEQKVPKKQLLLDYVIFGIALIPALLIFFVFLFVFIVLFSLFIRNTEWFHYLEFLN